jgi:hypothetical protein
MMASADSPSLSDVLEVISSKPPAGEVVNIYLWGSRVYGTASPSSDWDYNGTILPKYSSPIYISHFFIVILVFLLPRKGSTIFSRVTSLSLSLFTRPMHMDLCQNSFKVFICPTTKQDILPIL